MTREDDLRLLALPDPSRQPQLAIGAGHRIYRRTYALVGAAALFLAPTVYLALALHGALVAVVPALAVSAVGTAAMTGLVWERQERVERHRARRALKRFIGVDLDNTLSRAQFLQARRGRH